MPFTSKNNECNENKVVLAYPNCFFHLSSHWRTIWCPSIEFPMLLLPWRSCSIHRSCSDFQWWFQPQLEVFLTWTFWEESFSCMSIHSTLLGYSNFHHCSHHNLWLDHIFEWCWYIVLIDRWNHQVCTKKINLIVNRYKINPQSCGMIIITKCQFLIFDRLGCPLSPWTFLILKYFLDFLLSPRTCQKWGIFEV